MRNPSIISWCLLLLSGSWASEEEVVRIPKADTSSYHHDEISLGQQHIKDIHKSLRGKDPVHTFSAISDGIEHQLNTIKSLSKLGRDGNTKEFANTIRSLVSEVKNVDQDFLLLVDSDNDVSEALQSKPLDDFSVEELDDVTDEQLVAMFRFTNAFKGHEVYIEHLEGLKDIIRTLDNVHLLPDDQHRRLQEDDLSTQPSFEPSSEPSSSPRDADANDWFSYYDFEWDTFPNFGFGNNLEDIMRKARESARQRFAGFHNPRHGSDDEEGHRQRVKERNFNRRKLLAQAEINPVCFPPCDVTDQTCQCQRLFNCIGDMSSYDLVVHSTLLYIDSSTGDYTKKDINVFDLANGGILGKYYSAKQDGLLNDPSDLSSCTTVLEQFHTTCDPMDDTGSCPNDDEQAQSFQVSVEQVCESVHTTVKLLLKPIHDTFETAYYGSSCGLTREQFVWVGCGYTFLTQYEFYKQCSGTPDTKKIIFDSAAPGKTSCGIINDQPVYSGCGYVYAFEVDCMTECCNSAFNPSCTKCEETKANVNGWIDPEVATNDSYCGSVSLAACATFAIAFDRLYQARNVTMFPRGNPMLADPQVPVYNMKDNSIWNNTVFPTSYQFFQSEHGVNYPEKKFEPKYTNIPNFPGGYILGANIALGKPANQSSNHSDGTHNAGKAVDGNLSTFSHTDNPGSDSWWKVNLEQSYSISRITIYNRQDCCQERLTKFYVQLIGADGNTVLDEKYISSPVGDSITLTDWPQEVLAAYVQIYMPRRDFPVTYLHMAEVQVYGNYLGMSIGPNCVSGQFDNVISSQVASTCDESMALLLGDNMSLGTLIAVVNAIEENDSSYMPGTCCQDNPTTSEYFGSFYDPKEDMTCQHQGMWHLGISPSACKNGGGYWFRKPCVPLKNCIDSRPKKEDGPPLFSKSFEEWAVDLVIVDANDEAQCAHTREGLGFDADYPYDAVVCDEFNRRMCEQSFDDLDEMVNKTTPDKTTIKYSPPTYPPDPKLEKIELPKLHDVEKVDDTTSKKAIDALQLTQQAAAHSYQIVSLLGRKTKDANFLGCSAVPGCGVAGNIVKALCFAVTLGVLVIQYALEFITLSLWIATANTYIAQNQKKPNYAKLNYKLIFEDREWNFNSLNVINDNIYNQHVKVRDQLQERHVQMVNDINVNTVNAINEQTCIILQAMGAVCDTSGRRLEGEVPEVNVEVWWPVNASGEQNPWAQLRTTDRSVDMILEDACAEEPSVNPSFQPSAEPSTSTQPSGRKPKHDKEDANEGNSLFGNRALASALGDINDKINSIEDNIDREMTDMKGDIVDIKGDIAEIKTQMSMLVGMMTDILNEKGEREGESTSL